ncbi:alpha/beta hydrolase [Zhongshania sp.]|uniref:alpha/beta hydrolase n=1 Tax=Zhongshania sp. TaxID=1971902 RepID=UPI00356AB770
MNRELYEALGLHQQFGETQGRSFLLASANGRCTMEIESAINAAGDKPYHPCLEATPDSSTPKGTVHHLKDWHESRVFPNTTRDIAVYRPHGVKPGQALSLLLCFDGANYLDPNGPVRAAQVLDTLIARGDIPATAAVFVNPGLPQPFQSADLLSTEFDAAKIAAADQRSIEYDSLCDTNARFILDDVLPLVSKSFDIRFSALPSQRIVCGLSSSGIAAFTLAWHFPTEFARVLSHCGSYVNLRGGHHYPYLVRTTERKPIRVYLQSGAADANITFGSWPLANQQMAAALDFAGYDYHFEFGSGGHSLRHGGAVFADSLRWLFRGETP